MSSGHAAKRQRLTGSFSPASPPYHQDAKPRDQTKPVVHPNTPTSPPYPSMNSHSNESFPRNATVPLSEMTPPSSVHMSQQVSQSGGSASHAPQFSTPNSIAGAAPSSVVDSEGDAVMADDADDGATKAGEHRHTNHERQGGTCSQEHGAVSGSGGAGLFKLCQSSHPKSRPHSTQNLFELFGLSELAKSVARTDPVTGAKINKLRKSYEGKIKDLHIAGKAKAVKMDLALLGPLDMPDEEWSNQKVSGREYETAFDNGQLTSDFDNLLTSALDGMGPGPLPPPVAQKYRVYLGTDETTKSRSAAPSAPPNRGVQPLSTTPTPMASGAAQRISRPERSGAKRSYTDSAFQGYGEGLEDGYSESAGDDDGQGGMKRRKLGFEKLHSVEVGGARR